MQIEWRLAQLHHLPAVTQLFAQATQALLQAGIAQWNDYYPSADLLRKDIEQSQMYVAFLAGTLAAAVVLNDDFDLEIERISGTWQYPAQTAGVIHRLCVNPALQGNGLGTQAVLAAHNWFLQHGKTSVRIDVYPPNHAAMHLYQKLGYQKSGEVAIHERTFFLFEKALP